MSNHKTFVVTSMYIPLGKPLSLFDDIEMLITTINTENKESIIHDATNCDMLNSSNNDTKY